MTMHPRPPHDGPAPATSHVHDVLNAYVDDELPPAHALAVADHLTTCAECSAAYEALLATVATLREDLVYYPAPDTLRVRIRAAIRDAAQRDTARADAAPRDVMLPPAVEPATPEPVRSLGTQHATPLRARRGRRTMWAWGVAASLTLVALSSGATMLATGARQNTERVEDQVLASHIRSLMPDHLTDIRSNDQHNVKPWFNGRLDFSPAVPRFDDQGFPLLGGRLDYVAGRPVAAVVYGRRQHIINAYLWPTPLASASVSSSESHGYHMVQWRDAGVEHWLVSDLNAIELQQFATMLRQGAR